MTLHDLAPHTDIGKYVPVQGVSPRGLLSRLSHRGWFQVELCPECLVVASMYGSGGYIRLPPDVCHNCGAHFILKTEYATRTNGTPDYLAVLYRTAGIKRTARWHSEAGMWPWTWSRGHWEVRDFGELLNSPAKPARRRRKQEST